MKTTLESLSPAETRRLGRQLGPLLAPGDVVLLQGELGAGKTCFAQGIGAGLKVVEPVKSSSFVLVNEYSGRLRVYHADLFRLEDPQQVFELGLEENARDGLLLVEWPDRALLALPPEHLMVRFESTGDKSRRITFEAVGKRYEEVLARFEAVAGRA
jgi:tRNA threonylcarbamoyladenosine biosynthesis protein TsaE